MMSEDLGDDVTVMLVDVDDDFGGGDTQAHYLPNEPRKPAFQAPACRSRGCLAPLSSAGHCVVHFTESDPDPDPSFALSALPLVQRNPPTSSNLSRQACPRCEAGELVADLPEITAWSCGHWARKQSQSI